MSDERGDSAIFALPSLGADMERATVLEWYVSPGDPVVRGQEVALVSTEKADVDVEIWQDGVITEQLVELGREIPVGTPLLAVSPATASGPATAVSAAPTPAPSTPSGGEPTPSVARPPASPLARRLADQRGIDLAGIEGSGPGGAVLARDVERPPATVAKPAPVEVEEAAAVPTPKARPADTTTRMRRAIADRMARANREIPHYYLETEVDLAPPLRWLELHNDAIAIAERVLPAALFLKATATAAAAVPELNGYWVDDRFVAATGVDIAVAVSIRGGGLMTPTIRDVDQKSPDQVMADLTEIVQGVRRGTLRSRWMSDAGLTVTSLGDRGVEKVTGVIHRPQVALVGFGRIGERAWVEDGEVVARPVVSVTLAADHRATDGAVGSRFLNRLATALHDWEDE